MKKQLLIFIALSFAINGYSDYVSEQKDRILQRMSGVAEYLATLQDEDGAIIDPYINREHQYSTPYFAAGAASLINTGTADRDLRTAGILAMDKATQDFMKGHTHIPDGHGEFYLASLTLALQWLNGHVPDTQWKEWESRLKTPLENVIESKYAKTNNWRTYAMKGEWLRAEAGLVNKYGATKFIEDAWLKRTQRARIVADKHNLYQDWNGDPQSLAVEAVGRGNLAGLIAHGYDGPSAAEIKEAVLAGTETALYLLDATGQAPPNGRTDNHVFNDLLYGLIFDTVAEHYWSLGEEETAEDFRWASILAYASIRRWQRNDHAGRGSFYITKNAFDPEERIGYQPASQYTNYNATILFHLAEAWHTRKNNNIPAGSLPATSGNGFIKVLDDAFGSMVISSGSIQLFLNLRGDSVPKYGKYWTPLGITRIAMSGWDSRLGPIDGHRGARSGEGISYCPVWKELGRWVSLIDKAEHYRGTIVQQEIRMKSIAEVSILYTPHTGVGGPSFYLDIIVNSKKIELGLRCANDAEFGLLIPCLESDGKEFYSTAIEKNILTTAPQNSKSKRIITVDSKNPVFTETESLKTAAGLLKGIRIEVPEDKLKVTITPVRE